MFPSRPSKLAQALPVTAVCGSQLLDANEADTSARNRGMAFTNCMWCRRISKNCKSIPSQEKLSDRLVDELYEIVINFNKASGITPNNSGHLFIALDVFVGRFPFL